MRQKKLKNRRGRPVNHPLDFLKGRIWFVGFWQRSGWLTPNEISWKLDKKPDTSRKWRRYRDGLRIPKTYGASNPVAQVEAEWPGTAEIFTSPIWPILKGNRLDNEAIEVAIAGLGSEMETIILGGGFSNFEELAPGEVDNTYRVLSQMSLFPTFEMLQAIILMLAWADNLGRPDLWNSICGFYRHMIPEFIRNRDIPFRGKVFTAVDRVALFRTYTATNRRVDVFQPWTDQLTRFQMAEAYDDQVKREFWEKLPKHYREKDL